MVFTSYLLWFEILFLKTEVVIYIIDTYIEENLLITWDQYLRLRLAKERNVTTSNGLRRRWSIKTSNPLLKLTILDRLESDELLTVIR